MREIDEIIIHCSASTFGNAALIDHWHRQNGWDCIGYHYVILNGSLANGFYNRGIDGVLESGRPEHVSGAHCLGRNANSIGVCLIGEGGYFTYSQMEQLKFLIKKLRQEHGDLNISFHSDYNKNKPMCPGITAQDLLGAV